MQAGRPQEEGLFVARAALQALATGSSVSVPEGQQPGRAEEFLADYARCSGREPPATPPVNFAVLAIKVCPMLLPVPNVITDTATRLLQQHVLARKQHHPGTI